MNSESSKKKNSYGEILKSSSIMGGSAAINLLIGMVRTKFVAVLIGTGGVGLLANYSALQGVIGTVAGLGVQSSAVRDVAAAVAKNDDQAIGRTILTLRRICWVTGFLGAFVMMILSPLLSQWTFGSREYTLDIALLGICILLGNLSGGQMALIQGMRRIADIARINVFGTAIGSVIAIGFYFWLGLRGIVPALLASATFNLAVSWFYARRVPVPIVHMSFSESFHEAGGMVKLGLVFMWNAFLGSVAVYVINSLVTQGISISAVGIYTAAFALSGMFVNFVLSAMGADYYPRLTAVAHDNDAMNRMVNDQTEIGLLLAVPGMLATMSLAPWIIYAFYTSDFLPASNLLQWFILGCLGKVISWPLGIVMLALGRRKILIVTETMTHGLHMVLVGAGLFMFGIEGAAIAFFVLYIIYIAVVYMVARHLTGFSWSHASRRLLLTLLLIVVMTFIVVRLTPLWAGSVFGVIATFVVSLFCMHGLVNRIGYEHRLTSVLFRIWGVKRLMYGLQRISN